MDQTPHINYFAQTDFRGKKIPFGIKSEDRAKHMYIIGKTGMGKSTMLENMAIQDIKNGEGICFIDPHGKTAELLLEYIPRERLDDVLYIAPFDLEHPVAFNVMEDIGRDKRHLVAAGLMSAFKKIWVDAWSARMEYILNNTILALLEYPGSTLLSVNRMIADKNFRNKVVEKVTDPGVRSFWVDEFANYTDRFAAEATPAIQNKVGQFTSNPLIRNILGQTKSSFDFRELMDDKKIVIINLSKGRIGEGNANLIGSMLITKIYLAAMSRASATDADLKKLPPFYLYVDEFQSFANESFADILSEARKYKLSLTIAHQYIEQMPEEVRDAVFGNVGTTVTFRVGPLDAEVFEKIFFPTFTKEDMVGLGFAQIYLSLSIDGIGSKPFSAVTLPPILSAETSSKEEAIRRSRAHYTRARELVEKEIMDIHMPATSGSNVAKSVSSNSPSQNNTRNNNFSASSDRPKRDLPPPPPARPSPKPVISKPEPPKSAPAVPAPTLVKAVPLSARPVSLSDLRAQTAKDPQSKSSEAGRSALRSALAEIMNASNKSAEPKPAKPNIPEVKSEARLIKPEQVATPTKPAVAEVPEDILRGMLNVDGK
ncbi:MAG: hypothetical protein A2571_01330 [Candidatus Vogelbacteria bacterium RIFOXYD1_FULL_44_32]|uniref:Type IV secretion system coupling protein TraD DNA-binding domain-containing protein n=1 Tax=Candidatus Vogelbacteria bacterium RIFOXYD1_FULL_44_32 TaxID=1802438 RepID=A0A1G2QCU7_9BACT|nr:MAG: hypothetical protein A2571_01330 [Candidatus Vogelbacteria bacterium RIFOXYD1_FULL_44_32]